MIGRHPFIPFSNSQLSAAWKPFSGEGNDDQPADFSGRCFWLNGTWNAVLANGLTIKTNQFAGDWPFVDLLPIVALKPDKNASAYEISSELINKYLFTSLNAFEQYILLMLKFGHSVTNDGVNLGNGSMLRWGVNLSSVNNQSGRLAAVNQLYAWIAEHSNDGFILFEILGKDQARSFFEGRDDAKGNKIENIGSILHPQKETQLSGLPLQWHMRKIAGWPLPLSEGIPVISARMESDDDFRTLLLLHRLYGRRFKNTIYLFFDKETFQNWQPRLHRLIPLKASGKDQGTFHWPQMVSKSFLVPDLLWDVEKYLKPFIQKNEDAAFAAYGWSFCYLVLKELKEEKSWDNLFVQLNLFPKLPITFPVKEVIDKKKWIKHWHSIVGDKRLEELDREIWTFSEYSHQWHSFGSLAELLAEHSLLPVEYETEELLNVLLLSPLAWQKIEIRNIIIEQNKLSSWPIFDQQVARYLQKQRELWYF